MNDFRKIKAEIDDLCFRDDDGVPIEDSRTGFLSKLGQGIWDQDAFDKLASIFAEFGKNIPVDDESKEDFIGILNAGASIAASVEEFIGNPHIREEEREKAEDESYKVYQLFSGSPDE